MQRICSNHWCAQPFEVTAFDQAFFAKLQGSSMELRDIPPPTLCPDCRQQRRLVRRNERKYFHRRCDLCGSDLLSMYPADTPFPVYCSDCWWSDRWDPLSYGRDLDFSRPFFDQFRQLQDCVPRQSLFGKKNENCKYISHSENNRSCYMTICAAESQQIFYSKWIIQCQDCCDCFQLEKSDLCFESQYSVGMHNALYTFLADQSANMLFCYDCESCSDCLLCSHLRHKRFCIRNEQLTETEYRKRLSEIDLGSSSVFRALLEQYHRIWQTSFHREHLWINVENSSGDYLYNCHNVHHCFGVIESRDCAYCYDSGHMQDCEDTYEPAFDCELQYDCHACNRGKRIMGCSISYDIVGASYCDMCHNAFHLFGCIGLRHKEYCLLNRQYSRDEYEALVLRVIEHMRKTGEWGGFLPALLSPFAYNESAANEHYPLTEDEAAHRGFSWREREMDIGKVERVIEAVRLPDHIDNTPDDILNWAILCEATQKPFRIVKQELALYRQLHIPIPRIHPDERYRRRMAFTNPRSLHMGKCSKCGKDIQTTFPHDRAENIYCDVCYLAEVY